MKAITDRQDYASICNHFPEIVPVFHTFLNKHGYTADFNCYCIYTKNLWEDPDRMIHILRPLLTPEQNEESTEKYTVSMRGMRRVFTRTALLSTGDGNYFHNLSHLFRDEVIALCQRETLSAADKGKIDRRKTKRPLAEKAWERAKLILFSDNGDVLKGVSGSSGEAVVKVCIINGPEEFYTLEKRA